MGDDFKFRLKFDLLPGSYDTGDRDNTDPVQVVRVRGGYLWEKEGEMPMFQAFVYRAKFVEDFDGAAKSYGWDKKDSDFKYLGGAYGEVNLQKNLQPLESKHGQQAGLANAAKPFTNLWHGHDYQWVGVYSATPAFALANGFDVDEREPLRDKFGKYPAVQPLGAPAPGYYVSQCPGILNKGLPDWDQRKYVDSTTFPYIVLPSQFKQYGCAIGDVGIAIRPQSGRSMAFAFADTGTVGHLGESSSYLYRYVSEGRGNSEYITFIVFPRSNWAGRNCEGLDRAGAIDFRVSGCFLLDSAENAEELPLLMSLGADLGRFKRTLADLKAGKSADFSPADLGKMLRVLKQYGYDA